MNPRARRHRRNLRAIRRSEHSRLTHVLHAHVEAACTTTPVNTNAIRNALVTVLSAAREVAPSRHPNAAPLKAEREAVMRTFGLDEPAPKVVRHLRDEAGRAKRGSGS
jgi:hypothetical protein